MAGLMKHQYKKLPVTMKMGMQFNVMPWTSLGVGAVPRTRSVFKQRPNIHFESAYKIKTSNETDL